MSEIDPYDDGVAIVLELSRAATEADVEAARDLLDQWLDPYEWLSGYRNCGVEAEVGARQIVLWADRMRDEEGPEAVIAHARQFAEQARGALPVAAWKVTNAEEPVQATAVARLGAPVIALRPGGDAVADLRAAGVLPTPTGLRPGWGWLAPIFLARLLARLADPPLASWLKNGVTVVGVAALAYLSRDFCRTREHVLAVLTCLAAAAMLTFDLGGNAIGALASNIAVLILGLAWVLYWVARGK